MIENIKITKPKPYMQYRKVRWLNDFISAYGDVIQENIFDYLNDIIDANTLNKITPIVTQLSQYYYGLPFLSGGGTVSSTKYDNSQNYDYANVIYDDGAESSASVDYYYLHKYLKFLLNYKDRVFNIDMLVTFIADFCDLSKKEIAIYKENVFTTVFLLPTTNATLSLIQMKKSMGGILYGFPVGRNFGRNVVELELKENYDIPIYNYFNFYKKNFYNLLFYKDTYPTPNYFNFYEKNFKNLEFKGD